MQEIHETPIQPNSASVLAEVPVASCPQCHQPVREQDFFCPNCGKNLKPAPASTGIAKQLMLYVGSVLLPPLGYIWGIKYLLQKGGKAKVVGIVCILITTASLWFSYLALQSYYTYVQTQVEEASMRINRLQGY